MSGPLLLRCTALTCYNPHILGFEPGASLSRLGEPQQLSRSPHARMCIGLAALVAIGRKGEDVMSSTRQYSLTRRGFCFCCIGSATFVATGSWLTPQQVFAEARMLLSSQQMCAQMCALYE